MLPPAAVGSRGALRQLSPPRAACMGVIDAGRVYATLAALATADGTTCFQAVRNGIASVTVRSGRAMAASANPAQAAPIGHIWG